jgi:hypothetical protein
MRDHTWIRILFYAAGAYDGVLGLAFLAFPLAIYDWFAITPPNHVGYVQFPASLLVAFGLMFVQVARHPVANRNLIPYGILLKVAYCAVTFGHWVSQGIPNLWKPFAVADMAFAILFLWSYTHLSSGTTGRSSAVTP